MGRSGLLLAILCAGCVGEAEWVLVPGGAPVAPPNGARPVRLSGFHSLSAGLPAAAEVKYTAHLDGSVYAVVQSGTESGLYVLPSGASRWEKTGPALRPGEQFRFVVRIDLALYATAANVSSGQGSVWRLDFGDDAWERLEAPDLPATALVKKGGELLLAAQGDPTTAGLYASSNRGATWTKRADATKVTSAFLRAPVRTFVAAPAQQRMFAVGDAASGFGGLHYSDDSGATWSPAPLEGDVRGIHAAGQYVFVDVTTDGPHRSDNYGSTWHPMSLGASAPSFFVTGERAFAGTSNGVKVSDDAGQTWRDASDGLPPAPVHHLYLAGSSLFAAAAGQVFVAALE